MNPPNSLTISHRSRWAVRLTLGAILASMLLSSLFNVLVAWHLHALTAGSDFGTRPADAVHGQASVHEVPFAMDDVVERVCEAIKHCPCAVVWDIGQTTASLALPEDLGWFAEGPAVAFQSYRMDVPQHPPNRFIAVRG